MRALVLHHDYQSALGPIGETLVDRGISIDEFLIVEEQRWSTPNVSVVLPDFCDYDFVCALGSPWSIYDPLISSWLEGELEQMVRANAASVPIFGVCFGAQALAVALGGSVGRAAVPEIGWYEVESMDENVVSSGLWFEYHFDAITPPPGARVIARSTSCVQAFTIGSHLGVQFHPEANAALVEMWLDDAGRSEVEAAGFDPSVLERQTVRLQDAGAKRTATLVNAFVNSIS